MAEDDIPFDRSLESAPREVAQVSPLVRRLIAGNAGPFTFTGTCTYIVGLRDVVVIDPGPVEATHCTAVLQALAGCHLKAILVTHTHRDHSPGAAALKAATGAPVYGPPPVTHRLGAGMDAVALDAAHDRNYAPDAILEDGTTVACEDFELAAVATPGHTSNHLAFALARETALFSGDHVMTWSTTVVAPPDGSMHDYMLSLNKLLARTETVYWPGHGSRVRDPQRFVRALLHHRRQREHAILGRLRTGDRTTAEIVRAIYHGLAPALQGAARLSVLAHLEDLKGRGLAQSDGEGVQALWGPAGQFSAS